MTLLYAKIGAGVGLVVGGINLFNAPKSPLFRESEGLHIIAAMKGTPPPNVTVEVVKQCVTKGFVSGLLWPVYVPCFSYCAVTGSTDVLRQFFVPYSQLDDRSRSRFSR